MKAKEVRDKKKEELENILQEKRVELCQLRFDLKANQLQNHRKLNFVKKDIARIVTILKENKEQ